MPAAVTWPTSPVLLDARGVPFHVRLSSDQEYCLPVSLEKMGKWLPLIAVAVEDKRFYRHPGVDPIAVVRALKQNVKAGRVVSGASTITSQVMRLTHPKPRSFSGKCIEFVQAVKLERSLSKREILETYLNRAPFGGPVRGVEAAARSYFNKNASELSLAESALLIGMLRGPSLYRPDKNPDNALRRRDMILCGLRERRLAAPEEIEHAFLEKAPPKRGALPQRHRYFADLVLRRLPANYWNAHAKAAATTLDPEVQALLELRLNEALQQFPDNVTAAGGIVDNETGAVLAYVGNVRFSPVERGHWTDCGNSPRSPGSVLKPFIYLAAMEQGSLAPASLIADTPLSFGGLPPRNYDRRYRGPVAADFALANSLNAPAVRVLRQAGGERVIVFLRRLGFSLLAKPASHYGDSLALGGCEVTLLQTLQAFSTLATLGVHRPMTPLATSALPAGLGERRLFSAAGAYLITESLRSSGRASPALEEALRERGLAVSFKTGTSYGLRDAWTAAYNHNHTVVVWLGDPEGTPHSALSGLPAAAPPALRVMRDLPITSARETPLSAPEGLEIFHACLLSGAPATPFCPGGKDAWRIRGVTKTTPCALHVMREGALQTILPPELADHALRLNARQATRKERVDITMPQHNMRFFLTPFAEKQYIALTCEGAEGKVYWFVDEEFWGVQKTNTALLWPLTPGKHVISLIDQSGKSVSASFSVIDAFVDKTQSMVFE